MTFVINDTDLLGLAKHLHILRLEMISTDLETKTRRVTKARRDAEDRYKAARRVAAVIGLRPTESHIWWDVYNSSEDTDAALGKCWEGSRGAFVDAEWLDSAAKTMVGYWLSEANFR